MVVQVQRISGSPDPNILTEGPDIELRIAQMPQMPGDDLNFNTDPQMHNGSVGIDIYKGIRGGQDNFVLGGDGRLPLLADLLENLVDPNTRNSFGNLTIPGGIIIDFNRSEDNITFIDEFTNTQRTFQNFSLPFGAFYPLFAQGQPLEEAISFVERTYGISRADLDGDGPNMNNRLDGTLIINPDGRTVTGFVLNITADELREALDIPSDGETPGPPPTPREINFNDAQNLQGYFRDPLTGATFSNNTLGILSFDEGGSGNFIDGLFNNSNNRLKGRAITYAQGDSIIMNVPNGFSEPLSFDYASPFFSHEVIIYSGPNGTGAPLTTNPVILEQTFDTGATPGAYDLTPRPQINFSGTAQSVRFGSAPDKLVLDNIRLGSINQPVQDGSIGNMNGTVLDGTMGNMNGTVPVGGGIFQNFPPG